MNLQLQDSAFIYSSTVRIAFDEPDSELHCYIIMPEDQGNSGVKFKVPWLLLMCQQKSESKLETEMFEVSS